MNIAVSLDSTNVSLVPGEEVVVPLHVRNNGSVVEYYRFEVLGVPQDWIDVTPLEEGLMPGGTTSTTVTFRPPRDSTSVAGNLAFGVKVTPSEQDAAPVVVEGAVELLPFLETTAELTPRTSQGGRSGRHQVAIDNRGNVPVSVTLRGGDDARKVAMSFSPQVLTIPPGEAMFVKAKVRPRKRFLRGRPVTHPLVVRVEPESSTTVELQGSFVQGPVIPPWLLKALAALLALLLLLALLWFVVLKPVIESQAEEAAKEQAAKAEKAAQQAQAAAQQATAAGEKAASALAAPPAPIVDPMVTNPFSRRLVASGGHPDSYTVPMGSILRLNDLMISNPQGDFGRVTLSVEGRTLFEWGLENFRDLDYHTVVPITLTGGDTLKWAVNCYQPGQPPAGPKPTGCSDALYLGGVQLDPAEG